VRLHLLTREQLCQTNERVPQKRSASEGIELAWIRLTEVGGLIQNRERTTLKVFTNSSPGLRFGNPGKTNCISQKAQL